MIRLLHLTLLCGLLCAVATSAADKRAKTEDGKDVILRDDGTWVYADKTKVDKKTAAAKKATSDFTRSTKAKLAYKGKRGTFALYLIPDVWEKSDRPINKVAEVQFRHKEGDVIAMIIAERLQIPLLQLKEHVIENARAADKDMKVIQEEKRKVNGKEMIYLKIDVKVKGIPFTFMYYLYSSDEGSFQVITWTGRNLFKEYKDDMEALLNGFEIVKKDDA